MIGGMNAMPRSPARALFEALASLRLAVVVMVSLGLSSLIATIYESKHGTAAAQRDFYRTGWFAFILVMLGVNIFCAMMSRYPWKKHHTGFVMAHIGILTLLVGSLWSLWGGFDGNMAVYEGETTDRVSLLEKVVDVELLGGKRTRLGFDFEKSRPSPDRPRRFKLEGSNVELVADGFERHVRMVDGYAEATEGPSALRFILEGPFGREESWLVADDPERGQLDFGPAAFSFHATSDQDHAVADRNHLAFERAGADGLRYVLSSTKEPPIRGEIQRGTPLVTPWMGMKVTVDQFFPHAALRREVVPGEPPVKDERHQPAIRMYLDDKGGHSKPEWVAWSGGATRLQLRDTRVRVSWRAPELSVPFRVTLLDFNSEKYPGSNRPATYESFVRVDDPERGTSDHHISMNHPLHYRGYIFFQASFVEGQPMMSIFSVARAPGLLLVYTGTTLISIGVVWMFYVKPYLARRQAAQALKAHREREARHESESSVPTASSDPSARRPAQPAGSGA
jgi:hypothetical protein